MTREEVAKATAKRHKRQIIPLGMQAKGEGLFNRVSKPKDRFVPIKHRVNRHLSAHGR